MAAALWLLLTGFLTLRGSAGGDVLSSPTNVHLTSYNMDLVLRWDPPEGAAEGLVYRAEYKTPVYGYRLGCANVSALECSLSDVSGSINEFGIYRGRVRAELGSERRSAWVESAEVVLDTHTVIGPPSVSLLPSGDNLEVIVTDPVFATSSLRSVYVDATYNVTYWKDGFRREVKSLSDLQQNRVFLSDVEPWTRYCVRVQIHSRNPNPSESSAEVCERTARGERVPWVEAVVTFVAVATVVALVVLALVYRKSISSVLCPKDALPPHLKEYLLTLTSSTEQMQSCQPPEEVYHKVHIVADDSSSVEEEEEEGRPLEVVEVNLSLQPAVEEQKKNGALF